MPAHLAPITVEQAAALNWQEIAPPIVVTDGEQTGVGVAHGRVLPLVGGKRPYTLDIALPGGRRVYADTAEDVVSVIVAGEHGVLLRRLSELVEAADLDEAERVWVDATGLRHAHADRVRIELQASFNAQAQRDGKWDAMPEAEREMLSSAADPNGSAPVGIAVETPLIGEDGNEELGWIGMWFVDTPLVLNSGDYHPFSDADEPESCLTREDAAGRHIVVEGSPNLIRLDISSSVTYLDSLHACGWLQMTVRQPEQPDPIFQGLV